MVTYLLLMILLCTQQIKINVLQPHAITRIVYLGDIFMIGSFVLLCFDEFDSFLLFEHVTPSLFKMFFERIFEHKFLLTMLTLVGLPWTRMAKQMPIQLVFGLGPVWAMRTSIGTIAVFGNVMPF